VSVRAQLRRLGSESAIYGLPPIAQRLIGIFFTPIYTRLFTPADYGALSLIDATFQAIGPLIILSLDSAAFRWFYDSEDTEDRQRTLASWFWTQLSIATLVTFVVMLLPAAPLTELTGRPEAARLFRLAAAALPLVVFDTVLVNFFRIQRRPWAVAGITIASIVLNVGLTLSLVVGARMGLTGIYLAALVGRAAIALVAIALLRGWVSPRRFSGRRLREMLRYSLPMVPAAVFSWVIAASDRFVLAHYWDTTEVGLYSIGVAIAAVLSLFTGAFQNAWSPFAFSILDRPEARSVFARVFELYLLGVCLLALGLALFAPEALRILTVPRFYPAENVVAPIAIGFMMAGLYQITGIGAMIARQTRPLFHAFAISAAIKLVASFVLVPPFGRVGAAVATLVAQAVIPVYLYRASQRLYPIPYRWWLMLWLPGVALALAALGRALTAHAGLVAGVAIKGALALCFASQVLLLPQARALLTARLRPRLAG